MDSGLWEGNLKERDMVEELGVDEKKILKYFLTKEDRML
jgi:hypothetical protein